MKSRIVGYLFRVIHGIFRRGESPPIVVPPLTDTFYHRTIFMTAPIDGSRKPCCRAPRENINLVGDVGKKDNIAE